jgi:SAM-dependent methyltransferase
MELDRVALDGRAARVRYAVERFGHLMVGRVLDVGCDVAALGGLLPEAEYVGLDVVGDPDVRLDLEHADSLPFADASFDCVVCLDALEHLDNLHRVFDELIRVTRRHVVLSLPNNWANARRPVGRGKGSIGHYGLPVEPPADRHKWFFGLGEAADFVRERSRQAGASVLELRATEKPRPWPVRALRGS